MWLYVPTTSASSAEPEVLSSPSDSLCRTLAASVTSRGKLRRPVFWRRALQTRLSTTRLCGLMSAPSTVSRGAALWMESLAASRAKTSLWRESAKASSAATALDSSSSTPESFARLNRDGSMSKTSRQCSLFQQEESYSGNLPPWGSMRSGELFERPTWVPAISAIASSYWPTSAASDGERGGRGITEGMSGTSLTQVVAMWPTARASDGEKGGPNQRGSKGDRMLSSEAQRWTTPQAHDSAQGSVERVGRFGTKHGGKNLADDVILWRTPDAMLCGGAQDAEKRLAGGHALRLQDQVANWPTPAASEGRQGFQDRSRGMKGSQESLSTIALSWSSLPAQPQPSGTMCWCGTTGCALRSHKRKLNPVFVEWLMGWPLLWTNVSTAFEPAAMELYLCRVRQLLESLCGESGSLCHDLRV